MNERLLANIVFCQFVRLLTDEYETRYPFFIQDQDPMAKLRRSTDAKDDAADDTMDSS